MAIDILAPPRARTHPRPLGAPPAAGDLRPRRRPRWSGAERLVFAALLAVTALGYLWDLSASGWANSFYAAAVEAGTKSWKAFFFGSIDSSNFITVDKPPASLWVMDVSGRLFGFSSWSLLAPEALMGVATVALVYLAVRRWFGFRPAVVAGVVMATTPVAALMFRFDNPDALLTVLMTAAAYCTLRSLERASWRWCAAAGVMVGFGFLAKMGEALLILPALGLVYLVAAPTAPARRLAHLGVISVAAVASAGWWVLVVTLWPAGSRPMIDGSPTNSIWNLIVAYNGLGRVEASGGAGGGANFSGAPGLLRLFDQEMGAQASWLLPAAAAVLVGGLVSRAAAPRTDRARAALLLWGGWLAVTGLVFSYGQGVIHTYYTVALVPPSAALAGLGVDMVWAHRRSWWARIAGAAVVGATAWWAVSLLDRDPTWNPWLRALIVIAAAAGAGGLVVASVLASGSRMRRPLAGAALAAVAVATLAGPAAYAAETVTTAHTGSVPSAGPASTFAGGAGSGPGSAGGTPSGRPGGAGAPPGGATSVSSALVHALRSGSSHYRWVAATDGSQSAASIELASGGLPVMAIGGFNGQGGNLSLEAFEAYLQAGDIHYFVASGSGGGPAGGSSAITSWVESHFRSETIGGETVYDLTRAT